MDHRNPSTDDRAVATVVGTVLLFALTVVLATVVGTFALGFADTMEKSPSVAFSTTYEPGDDDRLLFEHAAGEVFDAGSLSVAVVGAEAADGDPDGLYDAPALGGDGKFSAGDRLELSSAALGVTSLDLRAASVRVAWTNADESRTVVLARWDGPAA